MLGAVLALVEVAVVAIAIKVANVGLGAALQEVGRRRRLRHLRKRRTHRAEALASMILMMESAESDAPGDLQEVLSELGPEWKETHGPYILAARRLATEFRALRNNNPDPKRDRQAIQHEMRNMLAKRKCRNKDMLRILPIALIMVFYPSRYEQAVAHAFGTRDLRDEVELANDPVIERSWWEKIRGVSTKVEEVL